MNWVEVDVPTARKTLQLRLEENQLYSSEAWMALREVLEAEKEQLTVQILNNTDEALSGKEVAWKGEVRRINWLLRRPEVVQQEIRDITEQLEQLEAAPSEEQPAGL